MNKMLRHIQRSIQHQINESGAEVIVEDLPMCVGDSSQIHQVFTNLLDNALKYLDPERKGQVKISGSSKDGESIYAVEDNGIGINPDYQSKVFEIFSQA